MTQETKAAGSSTVGRLVGCCCHEMEMFCAQYMIGCQGANDAQGRVIQFRFCPYCGRSITIHGISRVTPNAGSHRQEEGK